MEVKDKSTLVKAINKCTSIEQIETILKLSLDVRALLVWSDTELEEVKQVAINYVNDWFGIKERPFIITLGTSFKSDHIYN